MLLTISTTHSPATDWVSCCTSIPIASKLDPPRLAALERALFEFARPTTVVVTTPNAEYNVKWETLPAGKFRHPDHRFECTRAEFQAWASGIGQRFGYDVKFVPVGPVVVLLARGPKWRCFV